MMKTVLTILICLCFLGCKTDTKLNHIENLISEQYNINLKADYVDEKHNELEVNFEIENGFCLSDSYNKILSNTIYFHLNTLGYNDVKMNLKYLKNKEECLSVENKNIFHFKSKDLVSKRIDIYEYCLRNFTNYDYYTMESSLLKASSTLEEYKELEQYGGINEFFKCLNAFSNEINEDYSSAKILMSTIYVFYNKAEDKDLKRLALHVEEIWKLALKDENLEIDKVVKKNILGAYKRK